MVLDWCYECLGWGSYRGAATVTPLSSAHKNLRLRRSVVSNRAVDTDSDDDDDDDYDDDDDGGDDAYIHRLTPGTPLLLHPTLPPSTVVVAVQPPSSPLHRPDLQNSLDDLTSSRASFTSSCPSEAASTPYSGSVRSLHSFSGSVHSIPGSLYSVPGSLLSVPGSVLSLNSVPGSVRSLHSTPGSVRSLHSLISSSSLSLSEVRQRFGTTDTPTTLITPAVRRPRRVHHKFLTPEEAARLPKDIPPPPPPAFTTSQPALNTQPVLSPGFASSRLTEYPQNESSVPWRDGWGVLRAKLGLSESDGGQYAGQYSTEGTNKPVKLRSRNTLSAIAAFEGRSDTKNNPVWYTFGVVVVAVRYQGKMLEVDIVQATQLPPGKEKLPLDFKVWVRPGKRDKWVKGLNEGPSHPSYTFEPKAAIKISKIGERSLVISGFEPGHRGYPYLALGHGLVPNLGAQQLDDGQWHSFPLQLRYGTQEQDHLGMARVALSCCERSYGAYTFTADIMQLRNLKVQRLGPNVASSFKTGVWVWVRALLVTEGSKTRRELRGMKLDRPKEPTDQGWQAAFKQSCSIDFVVPKDKLHLSSIILQVYGKARHNVTSNVAELGRVVLGPHQLFGGELLKAPGIFDQTNECVSVPGDPLDTRLTQWGQALRRMAKVEMWHRLQI